MSSIDFIRPCFSVDRLRWQNPSLSRPDQTWIYYGIEIVQRILGWFSSCLQPIVYKHTLFLDINILRCHSLKAWTVSSMPCRRTTVSNYPSQAEWGYLTPAQLLALIYLMESGSAREILVMPALMIFIFIFLWLYLKLSTGTKSTCCKRSSGKGLGNII